MQRYYGPLLLLKTSIFLLALTFVKPEISAQSEVNPAALAEYLLNDYRVQTQLYLIRKTLDIRCEQEILKNCNEWERALNFSESPESLRPLTGITLKKLNPHDSRILPHETAIYNIYISALPDKLGETPNRNFFYLFGKKVRSIARLNGLTPVIVLLATEAAQLTAATILTAYGYPHLAALAPAIPFTVIFTTITIYLQNIYKNRKFSKGYGSPSIRRKAHKIYRQQRREIKLSGRSNITYIFRHPESLELVGITLKKESFFRRVGAAIFNKRTHKVFNRQLTQFAEQHLPAGSYVNVIKRSDFKNRQAGSLYLMHAISQDEGALNRFVKKYKKAIYPIDVSYLHYSGLQDWAQKAMYIKHPDEIHIILKDIPEDSRIGEVMQMLDQVILPYWSEYLKPMEYGRFKRFRRAFENAHATHISRSFEWWDKNISEEILENWESIPAETRETMQDSLNGGLLPVP